jgi:hypothetical protein
MTGAATTITTAITTTNNNSNPYNKASSLDEALFCFPT